MADLVIRSRQRWFIAALLASCLIHAWVLWGPDISLPDWEDSPPPVLEAHLAPLPPVETLPAEHKTPPLKKRPENRDEQPVDRDSLPLPASDSVPAPAASSDPENAPNLPDTAEAKRDTPASTVPFDLPFSPEGRIRFSIYKESLGMEVGQMEQRWLFKSGQYELTSTTQTVGLAALLKSLRMEQRSIGRFDQRGLQPERFETRKNGEVTRENAQVDWSAKRLVSGKNQEAMPLGEGAQDMLSLFYQLPFVKHLENGTRFGVATGKKFIRYDLDALGEEAITVPAGEFKTLHLRVQTDTLTEIWFAPTLGLPVKIRYTDKKGDAFVQLATDIGL